MQFTALALVALFAASPAAAFIAWSGWNCDGQGGSVPCDGSCWGSFDGRHSFVAGSPGAAHCVAFYVDGGCSGQRFNFTDQQGQCTAVVTGTHIETWQCFPGAACF